MSEHLLPGLLRRIAQRVVPARFNTQPAPCLPEGLCRIASIDPRDIVICGYPKSGNTWMQVLVAGAIYGVSPFYAPDSLVQDLVPDVHTKLFYRRYQTPTFFKSHGLPRPEYRRVIYLLRDGRDVMVSYMHYERALQAKSVSMPEMLGKLRDDQFPGTWQTHVTAWLRNPYAAEIITVKYEDLLNDPVEQLARICSFANVTRSAEHLEHVAQESRFNRMQQRERVMGWEDASWPKDTPFVRRGIAGSYRDEFPTDCLDRFMAESGSILRQCGYSLD